jgi:hypothetical protein
MCKYKIKIMNVRRSNIIFKSCELCTGDSSQSNECIFQTTLYCVPGNGAVFDHKIQQAVFYLQLASLL